jgi:hypothetical protein
MPLFLSINSRNINLDEDALARRDVSSHAARCRPRVRVAIAKYRSLMRRAAAGRTVLSAFAAKRDGAIGKGAVGLGRLQDCEHSGCTTQMKQAAADGGDRLAVASAQTETGAALVMASAEPLGGIEGLEAAHTLDPTFDAPVILLQAIVSIGAGPVWHLSAQC